MDKGRDDFQEGTRLIIWAGFEEFKALAADYFGVAGDDRDDRNRIADLFRVAYETADRQQCFALRKAVEAVEREFPHPAATGHRRQPMTARPTIHPSWFLGKIPLGDEPDPPAPGEAAPRRRCPDCGHALPAARCCRDGDPAGRREHGAGEGG